MDRNSSLLVIEDRDELEPSAEGVEIIPKRRDADVVGMLELRDRSLRNVEPTGKFGLTDRFVVPKLEKTDLLERLGPLGSETLAGSGARLELCPQL
jgi:hypothetical protein